MFVRCVDFWGGLGSLLDNAYGGFDDVLILAPEAGQASRSQIRKRDYLFVPAPKKTPYNTL